VMSRRLFGDFLVGDSYEEIPLERNAYLLDERYEKDPNLHFSVADEVAEWNAQGRFFVFPFVKPDQRGASERPINEQALVAACAPSLPHSPRRRQLRPGRTRCGQARLCR